MTATSTPHRLRWIALLTGLLLVLGATVASIPAHADTKTYTADLAAGTAVGPSPAQVGFTLSVTNTSTGGDGLRIGALDVGLPSGVTGPDGGDTIEFRNIDGLTPGSSGQLTFTASAVCDPATSHTFTVDAKQSNDFQGAGNDFVLGSGADLTVTLDCSGSVAPDPGNGDGDGGSTPPSPQRPQTGVAGEQSTSIDRGGQTVTVTGPAGGDIELSFADADDGTARIVADACQALVDDHPDRPARLSPNTFIVLPSDFPDGEVLTVTSTVPGGYVTQPADYATVGTGDFQIGAAPDDPNFVTEDEIRIRLIAIRDNRGLAPDPASNDIWIERILAGTHTIGDARTAISAKGAYESAAAFQLCFVGDKTDHGALTGLAALEGTDLFGPVLLDDCSDEVTAPCIASRDKSSSDVTVVATIPAEDPWMR